MARHRLSTDSSQIPNQVTTFGKFLDPIADKLIVAAALVVLLQWGRVGPISVIVILSREFIVSAFRTVAATKGLVISAGPCWARSKPCCRTWPS